MKKSGALTNWLGSTLKEKIATVLTVAIAVGIIVMAVLQFCGVTERAIDVVLPLLGFEQLLNAAMQWKKNRKIAIFDLVCAGIILACSAAVLIIHLCG